MSASLIKQKPDIKIYETLIDRINCKPDKLIYIGEGQYGCTADEKFFDERDKWEHVESIEIPRWYSIDDSCSLYRRKVVAKEEVSGAKADEVSGAKDYVV